MIGSSLGVPLSYPFSFCVSAFLMFISSKRDSWRFARRGEWNEITRKGGKSDKCVVEPSALACRESFCFLFLEKKRTHFSFLQGPCWCVWKRVCCSQSPARCSAHLWYDSKGDTKAFKVIGRNKTFCTSMVTRCFRFARLPRKLNLSLGEISVPKCSFDEIFST